MSTEISNGMPVITLDINEMGQMKRRLPRLTHEEQLENTLLQGSLSRHSRRTAQCPARKARRLPGERSPEIDEVFELDGVRFRLVGASASAKSGKFYAVDERYEPAIAERFRKWPEAAITYFGILVSPCKQRIQMPDARVMVVKDAHWARMTAGVGSRGRCSSVSPARAPVLSVPARIRKHPGQRSM